MISILFYIHKGTKIYKNIKDMDVDTAAMYPKSLRTPALELHSSVKTMGYYKKLSLSFHVIVL